MIILYADSKLEYVCMYLHVICHICGPKEGLYAKYECKAGSFKVQRSFPNPVSSSFSFVVRSVISYIATRLVHILALLYIIYILFSSLTRSAQIVHVVVS